MNPTIVAFVPMRHTSERVPQKSYRLFNGKPLFHWIVETLAAIPRLSRIVIDTDSPVISSQAPAISDKITIIPRPAHLCAGTVPMNEILLHDVSQVSADYCLQTHSTNPLLKRETVEWAIDALLSSSDHDSLFSVTRLQTRLWDNHGRPLNHDPDVLLRTQDLPPVYEENSNLYIFTPEILKRRKNRIGSNPLLFEIPRVEAWDIDEKIDFRIAEFLAKNQI